MTGAKLIAAERERQVSEEGYTAARDDEATSGELSDAGGCYALYANEYADQSVRYSITNFWPWDQGFWNPGDVASPEGRIRCLVKAGALIAAEIDRLQRLETPHEQ